MNVFFLVYYHMICFKPNYGGLWFFNEYANKVLSPVSIWSYAFVMNKYKSFRKIFKSKAPKTDPCGTFESSSWKVLNMLIWTDDFLFLKWVNESASLSKP